MFNAVAPRIIFTAALCHMLLSPEGQFNTGYIQLCIDYA